MQALPFDPTSDSLANNFDECALWAAPFGVKLLDVLELGKNLRLLDIGTGTGFPLLEAAMMLGESAEAHGLDPWPAGVRRTQFKIDERKLRNVFLHEGVAESMPFPDAHFDRVISNNGLNNVDDMLQSLREIFRVSKNGAQLVFTMNTEETFHELYTIYREVLRDKNIPGGDAAIEEHIHARRKPLREVETLIAEAGFVLHKRYDDQFRFRYTDGTALFQHYFIRLAFLGSWLDIVAENLSTEVFAELEQRLNQHAAEQGALVLSIPFVTYDCRKP